MGICQPGQPGPQARDHRGRELARAGAKNIRVMVVDEAVAAAHAQRITNSAVPLDGLLSLWLDSASQWPAIQAIVAPQTRRQEAYLVVESEPYPEERQARAAQYRVPLGERTPGMNQVASMTRTSGAERCSASHWVLTRGSLVIMGASQPRGNGKVTLAKERGVKELALIARAVVAQHGHDGMAGTEITRHTDGAGDVDVVAGN